MSDDTKHVHQDGKFISFEEDYQIDYWTGKLAVTRDHLATAIRRALRQSARKYLKHG
jgi:hypothetical protein